MLLLLVVFAFSRLVCMLVSVHSGIPASEQEIARATNMLTRIFYTLYMEFRRRNESEGQRLDLVVQILSKGKGGMLGKVPFFFDIVHKRWRRTCAAVPNPGQLLEKSERLLRRQAAMLCRGQHVCASFMYWASAWQPNMKPCLCNLEDVLKGHMISDAAGAVRGPRGLDRGWTREQAQQRRRSRTG